MLHRSKDFRFYVLIRRLDYYISQLIVSKINIFLNFALFLALTLIQNMEDGMG